MHMYDVHMPELVRWGVIVVTHTVCVKKSQIGKKTFPVMHVCENVLTARCTAPFWLLGLEASHGIGCSAWIWMWGCNCNYTNNELTWIAQLGVEGCEKHKQLFIFARHVIHGGNAKGYVHAGPMAPV